MQCEWRLTRTDGPRFVVVCGIGAMSEKLCRRKLNRCVHRCIIRIIAEKAVINVDSDFDITANLGKMHIHWSALPRFSLTHGSIN